MISFRKSFQKKILSAVVCLCMVCGLVWAFGMQASADSVPADFSFNVKIADSNTYCYYEGSDTSGTLSVSDMKTGSGSYNGGTITATNAGSSSTIYLKESGSFKNAEYILVPFTMSVKVPAYTAYTVDTKIQLSMNRNAKGSTWYVFEWTGNKDNAAYSKSFSTKMDLTTTEGFVYRAYGNDKSYTPTEKGTLVFDNRTGTEDKTITHQYAIFVGNSKSGSLLKSYHHQLETSLTLTPTSVTATKVITYYVDGQYYGKQQSSDDSITIPSSKPSKTGYVFTGWLGSDGKTYQPGDTYSGSAGLTLTAKWSEGKSTVTFNANEGAVSTGSKEVRVDSTYGELPTPTRDYYTFLGWYTAKTGGSKVTSSTTVTKTSDHTLYAHWMNKTAYVKLDPNGGSPSSSVTMNAGKILGDIPGFSTNPTRNDYSFAGWYTEKTGGTQVNMDTVISGNVTYYARWTGKESTVTLKYNDNSTADKTLSVNYGGTYSGLTNPTRTNYTFDGWYTAESGGSKVTSTTTVTAKANHTLYARWTRNTANIKFMDGDDTIASRTVNTGDVLGNLPTPEKTGNEFAGWYTAASGGEKVTESTTASGNATYYARWTASEYTVTFDKNDGTTSKSTKSIAYGSNYTLPDTPTRAGYTFKGWFTAASGGAQVTTDTVMTRAEAHTLYAQWERIVYTVTFKNGQATVETRRVNAREKLGTLPAATKTGYTFRGWFTEASGGTEVEDTNVISSGVTYHAQWTANQYTITFNPNGGTVADSTRTLIYGTTLGTLPTPTRTGYTFNGWYTAVTGGSNVTESTKFSTAADTTYYARWTANKYTVYFDYNGSNQGTLTRQISYGETYGYTNNGNLVIISTEPKRNDYNFVGWYTAKSGGTQVTPTTVMTTANNHRLYAHWETQHKHAVAPGGTAVEFTALTQSYINNLASKSASIGAVSFNYITLPAGNYYLTEDITTSYSIWLTGNVNLCFNGHTITSTFDKTNGNIGALMPSGSCQFAACDCQGGGGFTCAGQYVIATYKGTQDKCTVALYGGTFSGENTMYVTVGKTLIVDGATVKATNVAINAQTGANITIKSGLVTSDNSARDYNVATIYVYTANFAIEGGTITNTKTSYGYSVSVGSIDGSAVKLSGSPVIKGTAGDFNISGSNAKIEVATDLTGVYTVNVNGTVSKRSAWTITTESNRDVASHFVGKNSNIVLQDVVGDNSKHAVQLYTPHKHSNVEWNYAILNDKTDLTAGGQYVLTNNLTRDLTIPEGVTVDLCLNSKTLTGKITVNGTLNLYDCKNSSGITNNDGSVIVVGETGTLNYYGGNLTGGSGQNVPIYADGDVNLYATPSISTSCDYEIRGNSPGFLHICKTLTTKPSSPLRVNFGDATSVNITTNKQVTVTSGWSAYMSGKTLADYFAPRTNRIAKIDTNEDGELILRLLRVTIDGVTYYPAYSGGQITSLPATPTKTGYIWQGYYTAESGGDKKDISTSTVFEDDMTLYSQWKECDHSENTRSKETTAATCTTAGSEEYTCSVCGLAVENVIDALGHDYSTDWTMDTKRGTHYHNCATCSARVDEAEHIWEKATTTNATCENAGCVTYMCKDCTATKTETIPALGHNYSGEWLNDEANHWHKCSREGCDEPTTPAAHTWGAWVVTKAAGVNVKGGETSTCEICGKTKAQEIAALTPPEPTKYTVTYKLDEYTEVSKTAPTQASTAKDDTFTLNSGSGLTRTGYTFAGWALIDENGKAENTVRTGGFTMPERDVTFVVRWTRVVNYNLSSGDTVVLEDGTVIARDDKTVTIRQGGSETVNTTITLPDGSSTVTVKKDGDKDEIIVPAGSAVSTGNTTVTISGGGGTVEITGAVNAPAGSSVADGKNNTITINDGNGRIDTDGTVSFASGDGSVTVTDKNNNTTTVNVPAGSEGVTMTENGIPLVDNGNNGVTIVSADGTTTTITLPEDANENASIDEIAGGVTVPAGSTITTTKDGTTTTTTIKEGTGNVDPSGTVTLPNGGKVVTKDCNGNETESTVGEGATVAPHTHSWSDVWSNNETHHWHDCTAANCPVTLDSEKSDYTEHAYDQEVATEAYLKSAATCTAEAVYYKSCVCGAKGTETFESGDALGHSMTYHEAVAATCTEEGNVEYWHCSVCNKNFSDGAGTTELASVVTVLDNTSHKAANAWTQEGDKHYHVCENGCDAHLDEADCSGGTATCIAKAKCTTCGKEYGEKNASNHAAGATTTWTKTETTHKETYTCCGAVKTAEENHTWLDGGCSKCGYKCLHSGATNDGNCTTAVVCSTCGKTTVEAKTAHAWDEWKSNGNGEHTHSCTVVGCNGIETGNCSGGTATCKEKATCTGCNEGYGGLADHEYGDLISEVPATHMDNGTKGHYTCSVCEKNFDENKNELTDLTIEKLAEHTYDKEVADQKYLKTEADCTHAAAYYKSCECGEKSSIDTFTSGEALGHTGGTATCTEKAKCTRCKGEYGELAAHTPATAARENEVAATCTTAGSYNEVIYCSDCNAKLSSVTKAIDALGHDYSVSKDNAVAATCTEAGNETDMKCSRCDEVKTGAATDSLGHDLEHHEAETATCTEAGWIAYDTCKREGCSYSTYEEIPKAPHSYGEWIIEQVATEDADGSKHRVCSVCGHQQTETIPALTHTHTFDKDVAEGEYIKSAATCTSAAVYYKSCECGEKGTETFEYGSALDHSYEWQHDEDKHWRLCIRCDAKDAEGSHVYDSDSDTVCNTCGYEPAAGPVEHEHAPTKVDSAPASCTADGNSEYYTCTCGKWFGDSAAKHEITDKDSVKIKATGHSWDAGVVTTAPTTSAEGVRTYTCTVCSATKAEAIAKITIPSGGSSGGGSVTPQNGNTTDNVVNKTENRTTGTPATTTATVTQTTTTTTDGKKTTSATVDDTTATKIVDKAVSNKSAEVVVDTATNKEIAEASAGSATEIALPEKTVQELSQKTEASVTIKSDTAEVTLNKAALDGLAAQAGDDGYVRLVVETVKQEPRFQEVELKLVTSKGVVTDFRGGDVSITVKLGSALATKELTCVYISDGGIYHKVNGAKNSDGTYTFITGHFSSYAIMALDEANEVISEQTAKAKSLASKIQIKARSVKTAKGNIKVTLKITKGAASFKALEDMGYTLKYQFYRSTKMRKDYKYKFETLGKPYTNTDAKKGVRYYYKARIVVYDAEGKLITKTKLKKCWYATRIR